MTKDNDNLKTAADSFALGIDAESSKDLYLQASAHSYVANLSLSALSIDPQLQRKYIKAGRIERMVKNFDLDAIGVLEVSQRLGSTPGSLGMIHVLDGYHRLLALRELRKMGRIPDDFQVTCKVFVGLTIPQEARLFELLNTKENVGAVDQFRIRLVAKDPAALDIMRILTENNWSLPGDVREAKMRHKRAGQFSAISAMESAYATSPVAAEKTLITLSRAWDDSPATVNGELIQGFTMFYVYYGNAVDRSHLVNALSTSYSSGGKFLLFARETKTRGTTRNSVAKLAVETYNVGKKSLALPAWPHNGRRDKNAPVVLNTMSGK